MRIAVIGRMPLRGASGGRLVAIHWAQALAEGGFAVEFIVDKVPQMAQEFRKAPRFKWRPVLDHHRRLRRVLSNGFDIILVVPSTNSPQDLARWGDALSEVPAKVVLLSFETPNWFNALSPNPRLLSEWEGWSELAQNFGFGVAISSEGKRWADEYYGPGVQVDYIYPNVNCEGVSLAKAAGHRKKNHTIIVLSRPQPHKGLDQLSLLPSDALKGWTVRLFLGRGKIEAEQVRRLDLRYREKGMHLIIEKAIMGRRKFREIAQSSILFFPSYFEGFGIPPIEGELMGTPAVVSDLPVLRENGANHYEYFKNNDFSSLQAAIARARARSTEFGSDEWFDYIASPQRVVDEWKNKFF